jgi:hypothetical protein
MNTLITFTAEKNWHVDYKPNRQGASLCSGKTGWMEKGTEE